MGSDLLHALASIPVPVILALAAVSITIVWALADAINWTLDQDAAEHDHMSIAKHKYQMESLREAAKR